MNRTRLDLLDSLPKDGTCAEFGVFTGDFSREIIKRTRPKIIHMVDTFSGLVTSGDQNGENIRTVDMARVRQELSLEFRRDDGVWIRSSDSVDWMDNSCNRDCLDWCYIDTTHEYEQTKRELTAAYRVVKNGGFICGHDYELTHFPGVVHAVDELCHTYSRKPELFTGDKLPSYKIEVIK
jgi:hypothetical protein